MSIEHEPLDPTAPATVDEAFDSYKRIQRAKWSEHPDDIEAFEYWSQCLGAQWKHMEQTFTRAQLGDFLQRIMAWRRGVL